MARSARRARGFVCVPTFTAQPSIAGVAKNGEMLTGTPGTVANGAVSAQQWLRGAVAIAGATNATYVVQAADIGALITFRVTATNALNPANTVRAESSSTAIVVA